MPLSNTAQAIGGVSRLLVDHLTRRTTYPVNVGRPEDSAGVTAQTLNLFLYEAHFDAQLKNLPLAPAQPPPLWLTLKYLLTGFDATGNSDTEGAHDVLGQGVSALQELAFLGLDQDVAVGVRAALEDNPERLKLTFDECTVDLVNKITQASDDEYRLSFAFQVRPVMIVPPERPTFSLLVGVNSTTTPISLATGPVGLDVLASVGPQLYSANPDRFEAGDAFEILGNDLHISNLTCFLGSFELGITAQFPDRLRVRVETALQAGVYLSAGEHPLVVRQTLPATGRFRASNVLLGRLLPTVTAATTGPVAVDAAGHISATVTVDGFLLGRNEDSILVALYRDGSARALFDIVKPIPGLGDPPDAQQQLIVPMASPARVLPGTYQLIVVVNGQQARQSPTVALIP